MNKKRKLIPLMLLVITGNSLLAVDIENRDSIPYRITYNDAGTSHSGEILNPGQKLRSICGECDVHVHGLGTFHAAGSDKIIIENRQGTVK